MEVYPGFTLREQDVAWHEMARRAGSGIRRSALWRNAGSYVFRLTYAWHWIISRLLAAALSTRARCKRTSWGLIHTATAMCEHIQKVR